jgi:hypothetical protein
MAVAVTAVLFALFNIVATPLLNSGDDAFLMYTLGGGYGEAPTNLLHYDNGWHYWLGAGVKTLFDLFPGINWYTIILLLFHLCGCSAFFYVLLKRLRPGMAFLFFTIFFFFIETRFLISLTYTGAAFVAAAGAICLLQFQIVRGKLKISNLVPAALLLILAGMLRLQIAWLVLVLFILPAIILFRKKQLIQWIVSSLVIVVLLFGLNKIHQHYYTKNIPGWKQQEEFRQAVFYAYNRPIKQHGLMQAFNDSSEYQLFFAGFFYDSSAFSTERVRAISKQVTRKRLLNENEDRQGLYWFFIELRIYILLFGLIIAGLIIQKKYRIIKNWLWSLIVVGGIYTFLFVFMKLTTPLHLGLLMILWMQLASLFTNENNFFPGKKSFSWLMIISLLLLFGWMGKRVADENAENRLRRLEFLCLLNEINKHTQNLFVATDDSFPLGYFYIWDLPAKYPAHNLLYKDRLLTHTWVETIKRFGITDLRDAMLHNDNVFLLGPVLPALEKGAKTSDKIPGYQCLEVRKLSIEN